LGDLGGTVGLGEVGGEVGFFEVAVVGAVLPVAEVGIAEFAFEEFDDAVLGGAFGLSDGAHGGCGEETILSINIMPDGRAIGISLY
jgi:hypothetical protein